MNQSSDIIDSSLLDKRALDHIGSSLLDKRALDRIGSSLIKRGQDSVAAVEEETKKIDLANGDEVFVDEEQLLMNDGSREAEMKAIEKPRSS